MRSLFPPADHCVRVHEYDRALLEVCLLPDSEPQSTTRPERLRRLVQRLRAAVYSQPDPPASPDLLAELAKTEAALREAEANAAPPAPTVPATPAAPAGRLLGPESTKLKVEPALAMN